jgi:hypothetical protein
MSDDLEYDTNSFAGPFSETEMREFESWLQRCGAKEVKFDPTYLAHLRQFHGGVPGRRYFKTANGTGHVITRFLNFLPDEDDTVLAQYNVSGTWGLMEDRMGRFLIPFAELFGGDMLCFDYRSSPPQVVVWDHERSSQGNPHTDFVTQSFTQFLGLPEKKKQSF